MKHYLKRPMTKVALALALALAGYCAVPAAMAEGQGNLRAGQWQSETETTGTIQGTVPWITRSATEITDADKSHVSITVDRGGRSASTDGEKQFHIGDKLTANWAIGDIPCESARYPSLDELQSLYNRYPNGSIVNEIGWPVKQNSYVWWTNADCPAGANSCESFDFNTGQLVTVSKSRAFQACLVHPHSTVSTVTLTSTAFDSTAQAAKVKKGEAMPVTVTVKDSAGKPVPNVAFTLRRGDASPRNSGATLYGDVAAMDDITIQPSSGAATLLAVSGNEISGVTGADGTANFTVRQDNTPGYKMPLTVTLDKYPTVTAMMDTIFTVLTSPNVSSAHFWGHMADTAVVNGKTLHRPILTTELPSGANPVSSPIINYENWASAHITDASKWDISKQCGNIENAPTYNELETLYTVFNSLGWPASPSFPYLSSQRCGMDESTGTEDCSITLANKPGLVTCFQ
ncbi:hypothetical protein ONM20_001895 [Escherichia coli]|nr:hypothetical protein [Escherichia coli]EGB9082296.1 hypothetical protein [Escherichia coli]EJP7326972.1 hypothetical protein [Escherichia coli]EKB2310218.1 hypothetical protein [Escherichia coli]EKQ5285145.1 hypothetical protein [Escherichia coli]